ncbi:hypothetical protein HDV00_010394 [Rhizophlyctis rosea]|nr:hypothetical protein HDV00_010394 [Rhizophlyctis rosea]
MMLCAHARELERQAGELRKGVEKVMERFGVKARGKGRGKTKGGGAAAEGAVGDGAKEGDGDDVGKDGVEEEGAGETPREEMDISTPHDTEGTETPIESVSSQIALTPTIPTLQDPQSQSTPSTQRPSIPNFFDLSSSSTSNPSLIAPVNPETDTETPPTFPSISTSPTLTPFPLPAPSSSSSTTTTPPKSLHHHHPPIHPHGAEVSHVVDALDVEHHVEDVGGGNESGGSEGPALGRDFEGFTW